MNRRKRTCGHVPYLGIVIGIAAMVGWSLVTSAAPGDTEGNVAPTENTKTTVESFLNDWNSAIADRDESAIRAAYVDDNRLRWFEDGELRYESVDEIIAALAAFPPDTTVDTELHDVSVRPLADSRAWASASFDTQIDMPHGDVEFNGVVTMLLERHENSWRFVAGHSSSRRLSPARPADS